MNWKEFEISEFTGEVTNVAMPKLNELSKIVNFDTHERPGTATIRPGYELKYQKPSNPTIQSAGFVSFENFYNDDADPDGQEVSVLIQRGLVSSANQLIRITDEVFESKHDSPVGLVYSDIDYSNSAVVVTDVGGGTPYTEDSDYTIDYDNGAITVLSSGTMPDLNNFEIDYTFTVTKTNEQLCHWIRPYWDGSTWVDEWQWLNEVVLTKVAVGSDGTYKNMFKAWGQQADNYFVGWTIVNHTTNVIAQVITSKLDGLQQRINTTLFEESFGVNDEVAMYKNYINPKFMDAMNSATASDIVYHKILNDLRIGFGGKEDRVGLAIGYRKKWLKISDVNFTDVHADLTQEAMKAFSTIDEVVLTEYTVISGEYGMDLSESLSGTSLPPGEYLFRMTCLLDGNSEVLISEGGLSTATDKDIDIFPYVKLGLFNKRITDFRIYWSSGADAYYHLRTISVSNLKEWQQGFVVQESGMLHLDGLYNELFLGDNAVSELDTNNVGLWKVSGYVQPDEMVSSSPGYNNSTGYALKVRGDQYLSFDSYTYLYHEIEGIEKGKEYSFALQTKDLLGKDVSVYFGKEPDALTPEILSNVATFSTGASWGNNTDTLIPTSEGVTVIVVKIQIRLAGASNTVYLDAMSIKGSTGSVLTSESEPGAGISSMMGYVPTFNLVRDWEQCLVTEGRAYYMNPFIDKKWMNFIMKSAISAGFMYDAASAGYFIEADNFDGSDAVAITMLFNGDILVLKSNGIVIKDADSGVTKDFGYGKGCISRESVVNYGNSIIYCGIEDIYSVSSSGLEPRGLLSNTIRDQYKADRSKGKIVAVRDKYNTYRFRFYNPNTKEEKLLTERGWLTQVKNTWVAMYRIGVNSRIWFMNNGDLYLIEKEIDQVSVFDIVGTSDRGII